MHTYSTNLPKCITWIKPLNNQSVVWIFFRVSHDTFCKWEFCLFLFLKLRFIIYYYDHYWLEYLSNGPISGYGIIWNGLFSFLFLTLYPDNRKWPDKIGSFWFQTVKRWILNFYCRRDSYNLFIRYFADLFQWCLFTEHIRQI